MVKEIERNYFKTIFAKVIIVLLIVISFYGIIDTDFKSTFLETFSHNLLGIYNNLVLFIIFTVNIIYIYKCFSNSSYYIVRMNNRNELMNIIHKSIIHINFTLYIFYTTMGLFLASFLNFKGFIIEFYDVYNIPLILYIIFGMIRLYLLLYCLTLISEKIVSVSHDYKWLILYILIIFYLLCFSSYSVDVVSSIWNMHFNPIFYFYGFRCSYFFQEVLFSFLYIALLVFIIKITSLFIYKKKGDFDV